MYEAKQTISLTKKQKVSLEYAYKWLNRAQKDFNAFNGLMYFDKTTKEIKSCRDCALSVYLLQQSVEKATKAVAAATGKYTESKLREQGHNSLAVLLDFYRSTLNAVTIKIKNANDIAQGLGINLNDGSGKLTSLIDNVRKTSKDHVKGESLYREQFARASADDINKTLDLLMNLRDNAFVGTLRSIFGVHGKVILDSNRIDTSSPRAFAASLTNEAIVKLNLPQLTEPQARAIESYINTMMPQELTDIPLPDKIIVRRRDLETQNLGEWALLALLFLAMYTFPHESTSRYPSPLNKKDVLVPSGCEDYALSLGIVNRMGRINSVLTLVLDEIKPQLASIAASPIWVAK